jgi:hypothetical protein
MNTMLNGFSIEKYNWREELKNWSKAGSYFPTLTWEEFLTMARKYDFWNDFEKSLDL